MKVWLRQSLCLQLSLISIISFFFNLKKIRGVKEPTCSEYLEDIKSLREVMKRKKKLNWFLYFFFIKHLVTVGYKTSVIYMYVVYYCSKLVQFN